MEDKLYTGEKLRLKAQLVLLTGLVTMSKPLASLELFPLVDFEFVARALHLNNRFYFHKLDSITT